MLRKLFGKASKSNMNVQSFPRPPRLEKIDRHIKVTFNGQDIVETTNAYWVLETHHPPTYYIPPEDVKVQLQKTRRQTYCEWKGAATYYTLEVDGTTVSNRIWSYDQPTKVFTPIQGYVSMYASPWDCFVDGEKVETQPGEFYGGWVTSDIEGIVKGRNGNFDPAV